MSEAALRDRIEYLEAENAELRKLLRSDPGKDFVTQARKHLDVRRMAIRLLWVLWDCKPKPREAIFHALWGDSLDPPDIKTIDVYAHLLRGALHPCGARIETIWGTGYQLQAAERAKIAAYIGIEVQP